MKAIVFDIKRCSQDDGPAIRTTVFFKGCNLDCFWCHNPEGRSPKKQYALFKDKCIGCGVFRRVKPDALEEKTRICAYGARKVYGREYTTKELLEIILLDKEYYASTGGGVTFSGGECMLQISFLTELASLCKQNGVSVAVDTAGCVPYGYFEQILPFVDLFLYDVKCIDGDLHKRGTGQDNGLILDNLNRLIKMGKKIVIRTPVIPHFNDNNELKHIESYCNERKLPVEFLPYHEYGIYKNQALQNRE